MHRPEPRPFLAGLALAILAAPSPAAAAPPDKASCIESHAASQELRQTGKLREARERLQLCANPACPGIARNDCTKWLAEVERDLPTVVLSAKGEGGKSVAGVKVLLDGNMLTDKLDGAPVGVDPGAHVFRFEAPGSAPFEQKVTLKAGEKGKAVAATMAPVAVPSGSSTPPAGEAAREPGPPVVPLVLGGVGVLGLGAFAYFGLTGRSGEEDLKACKPRCPQEDVDVVKTKYIIADVALGVGVVSLGVATFLLLTRPTAAETSSRGLRFDVAASPGGGSAWLGGRF